MNDLHDPALTSEEQRLASLLAADAPVRKPNPALDAAILSAARNAVAPTTAIKRSKFTAWAPYTGLVATVALSGFLLLRYGNVEDIPNVPEASEAVADRPSPSAKAPAMTANEAATESRVTSDTAAPQPPDTSAQTAGQPRNAQLPERAAPLPLPPPPPQPPAIPNEPSQITSSAPLPLPTAPPAHPAPPAPQEAPIAKDDDIDAVHEAVSAKQATLADSAAQSQAKSVDRNRVSSAKQVRINAIPVNEDAKLDQDAWIKRIERRLSEGDRNDAKVSLNALLKRHPDAELPEVLQKLRSER